MFKSFKKMKKPIQLFAIILVILTQVSNAQDADETSNDNTLGISLQAYPAGFIPTVNYQKYLNKSSSMLYRLGANIIDRQDFSDENIEETGFGIGGSVGYRKYYGNFSLGFNLDLWNTWIDWTDVIASQNVTGETYTFVVQPWLEGGYHFNLKNKAQLGFTLGFGREINAITNGDDVAQDWIGSVSVQYNFLKF